MRNAKQRVTTRDVAARAGVSQPTVSLVLSRNPRARVAAATRKRVIAAAEELGYRPNMVARGLVQRRSFAIGIIIPDLDNPFFTEVVSGAERIAAAAGFAVMLCDTREVGAARHLEALQGRMVDGLIIDASSAASLDEEHAATLDNVVVIDQPPGRWPGVASEAAAAGRLAAEHLLELGHRSLAFIGPASDGYTFRMRERGFVAALREADVQLSSPFLRRRPASVAGGQAAMRDLLGLPSRPTAVFCANDLMALGALKSCLVAGVRVPEEISLAGCDDIELASIVTPELTSVLVPARGLGALAARMLLQRLDPEASARKPLRTPRPLPVRLIRRQTTAPPGGAMHE